MSNEVMTKARSADRAFLAQIANNSFFIQAGDRQGLRAPLGGDV